MAYANNGVALGGQLRARRSGQIAADGSSNIRKPLLRRRALKRAGDIFVATCVLIAASPIMLAAFALVRLTSAGPGIFWSERVGRGGVVFRMPKFRTMYRDAEIAPRESLSNAASKITPIGHVLRKTSIDELPQLWSVLKGDMSLVGPRPLLPNDAASRERQRMGGAMLVRPGITGLAQIKGRNHVSPRRKAMYDRFYVSKLSGRFDIRIILSTVACVLLRKNVM